MTPGERLESIMEIVNVTQKELAELCNTTQVTIHRMIKNKQEINFKVLSVLRKRYKVDLNRFFE